ncbi:hypothetical protein [Fluviispira vulneris]|uniref:hypothetical protein n=1 Tax=Fluviispira vulneris TaxID=2763012 RepID=UPI001644C78A|nr:hypothetical protein [Fluviispira vulneris]
MAIKRSILKNDKSIFIVKLNLDANDFIPEHSSSAIVTATVTSGLGIFNVGGIENKICNGSFIYLKPDEKHSIKAVESLEIIVHHININHKVTNEAEHICGMTKN